MRDFANKASKPVDVSVLQAESGVRPDWVRMALNGLLFNVSWFVIILSQSALIAGAILCFHLLLHFVFIGRGFPELRLITVITVAGLILDSALFRFGVFNLAGSAQSPLWLSCLWPVFATTLCHAFSWLQGRWIAAAVIGGVGGTASYVAGVGLTEISFGSALISPMVIAVLWVFLFPASLRLASALVPDDR